MISPGNDMDELFQKAAVEYPVRQDGNEWNSIAVRIAASPVIPKQKKGRRKYTGLVIFFFSIGMLSSLLTQLTMQKTAVVVSKNWNIDINTNAPGTIASVIDHQLFTRSGSKPTASLYSHGDLSVNGVRATISRIERPGYEELEINQNDINRTKKMEHAVGSSNKEIESSLKEQTLLLDGVLKGNDGQPTLPARNHHKYRGLFGGIVAGPQLNEVRSQGMGRTNLSIGILGGYQFSKRFVIETGILFSKKAYFSDGKYFHMKNSDPSMPSDMKVMTIDGRSHVFEIPVKLRYNLVAKPKSLVFSAIGFSSYILTKEKNDYVTMRNGNLGQMTSNYKDVNRYIAATFNLSAGYEHKLGKRNSIRLEPYIQIPVKGIGVGSMPVTSAGLHIGIFWDKK